MEKGKLMQYRAEIDGLRAVAVIPVILYHAGVTQISGGFIGVDVFFVISGYLITSIILQDLTSERFSILTFYERRIRRILPALFFVLAVSCIFAWLWMLPDQFVDFSTSVIATITFSSNFYFWQQTDYFARSAEFVPLLHTWSLAVEEQFYIFFPPIAVLIWRWRRGAVVWSLLIAFVLSIILCIYSAQVMPTANFYLAPTRAWELLAGALCAYFLSTFGPLKSDPLGTLGIVLICASIVLLDSSFPFPSFYTTLPVLGTCLIILFSASGTWSARILSARPLVGVGLISYSAYLWHQPVFAFARIKSLYEPSLMLMAGLVILSFILAALTWAFVEQPFRTKHSKMGFSRRQVFSLSAIGGVVLTIFAAAGLLKGGNLFRYNADQIASLDKLFTRPEVTCFDAPREQTALPCVLGDPAGIERLALLGDSHAWQWNLALHEIAVREGIRLEIYWKGSCPVVEVEFTYIRFNGPFHECTTWRNAVLDRLIENPPNMLVLANSSIGYVEAGGFISADEWDAGMAATLRRLQAADVPTAWLFDNPQVRRFSPVKCIKNAILFDHDLGLCKEDAAYALGDKQRARERQIIVDVSPETVQIELGDLYCPDQICNLMIGDQPMLADSNHLTLFATRQFASPLWGTVASSF